MSTAIAITSGKGGTGKTSLTGGVASCLAALGHKVLCIDMDIGLRNLDLSLGMSDRALMDFTDVVSGRTTLEKAAVAHPVIQGLYLLTAPLTQPRDVITEEKLRAFLAQAKASYDYVLMDAPAGRRGPGTGGLHHRRLRPAGRSAHRGRAEPFHPFPASGGQPGAAQAAPAAAHDH